MLARGQRPGGHEQNYPRAPAETPSSAVSGKTYPRLPTTLILIIVPLTLGAPSGGVCLGGGATWGTGGRSGEPGGRGASRAVRSRTADDPRAGPSAFPPAALSGPRLKRSRRCRPLGAAHESRRRGKRSSWPVGMRNRRAGASDERHYHRVRHSFERPHPVFAGRLKGREGRDGISINPGRRCGKRERREHDQCAEYDGDTS